MLAALLAAGTTSCIQDEEYVETPSDEQIKVHLQINTPGGSVPVSRSEIAIDENKVNNLIVLMFTADTKELQAVATPTEKTQDDNIVKFTANFSIKGELRNTEMEVVVLANVNGYDDETMKTWVKNHITYDNLQKQLQKAANQLDILADGIPMWGLADRKFVPSETTSDVNRLQVNMVRDVAKVDIVFKGNAINKFVPTKVYIYKPSENMSIMPLWGKFTHGDGSNENPARVTGLSLPLNGADEQYAPLNGSYVYGIEATGITPDTDLEFKNHIYLLEADIKKGGAGNPGDEYHTDRSAIIIEGKYGIDPKPTYYRIDFATGDSGSDGYKLCDVLRNHIYTVNIDDIMGSGYATPDEAYNSRVMYLKTNIVEWTPVSNNITFDGETSVEISDKTLYFTYAKGNIREVKIQTKVGENAGVDFKNWKLGWTRGEEAVRPETQLYSWFTVENGAFEARFKPGSTGEAATIQIRTTSVNGEVVPKGERFDLNAKSAWLCVLINKVRVYVQCVQCGKQPDDWDQGGDISGGI